MRHSAGVAVKSALGPGFPWGTLVVNLTGSFLIGFIWNFLEEKALSSELRFLVVTGFLGAFTTFSTFSLEVLHQIRDGAWKLALANVLASVVFGLILAYAGFALAKLAR